jgi:hypothetical protein
MNAMMNSKCSRNPPLQMRTTRRAAADLFYRRRVQERSPKPKREDCQACRPTLERERVGTGDAICGVEYRFGAAGMNLNLEAASKNGIVPEKKVNEAVARFALCRA